MDALKRTQALATTVLVTTSMLLAGLMGRVVWIEKPVTPEMDEKLSRQITAVIPLTPSRGPIVLSDGTPLAMSVRVFNLFADPAFIMDPDDKLNPLSGEQLKEAQQRLVEAMAPLI